MNITIHRQIIDLLEDAGMAGMTLNVSIKHEEYGDECRLIMF